MSHPVQIRFEDSDKGDLTDLTGRIALFADAAGALSPMARKLDRAAKGALTRAVGSEAFGKLKPGEALELAFPAGLAADAVQILRLPKRTDAEAARKAGASIGAAHRDKALTVLAETHPRAAEIAFGLALRAYEFEIYRSGEKKDFGPVSFCVAKPEEVAAEAAPLPRWQKGCSSPAI